METAYMIGFSLLIGGVLLWIKHLILPTNNSPGGRDYSGPVIKSINEVLLYDVIIKDGPYEYTYLVEAYDKEHAALLAKLKHNSREF